MQGKKCLMCLQIDSLSNTSLHALNKMVAMMSKYPWDCDESWRGIWKWGTDIVRVEDWLSSIYDETWLLPYHIAENNKCGGYFREFYVVCSRVISNVNGRSFWESEWASLFRRPESCNDPSFCSVFLQIVRGDSLEGNIISCSVSSIWSTGAEG